MTQPPKSNVIPFAPRRDRLLDPAALKDVRTIVDAISKGALSTDEDFRRALFGLEIAHHLVQRLIGRMPVEADRAELLAQSVAIEQELQVLRRRIQIALAPDGDHPE